MKTSTIVLLVGAGAVLYIATRPKAPAAPSGYNATLGQVNQLGGTLSGLVSQLRGLFGGSSTSSSSSESAQQAQQDANNLLQGTGLF